MRDQKLQELLAANVNKHLNVFKRKQIYICGSFNDWMPVELMTIMEIKKRLTNTLDELEEMDAKKLAKISKSKKKDENIIQYCNYMPPGKHYFYFMY